MTDGLYVGMTGATARTQELDGIADNLANTETPGFRATVPSFLSFLPGDDGVPNAAQVSVATVQRGIDPREGPVVQTDRPLDVRANGGAYLAVRGANDDMVFTRDGRLSVAEDGRVYAAGRPVLDDGGAEIIVPPGSSPPRVSEEGEIVVDDEPIAKLGLYKLEGPVSRLGPSMMVPEQGSLVTPSPYGVRVGEHEGSNASALETTVRMVTAQRTYDAAMQAIQTYRTLDSRAVETGRVR